MTFSISARCARTGRFGIAVASSSPAVAARCAHARAGVGVVATQNITDPRLGPAGLDQLAAGADAETCLARLVASTPHAAWRQLAVVDAAGRTATHSGAHTLGVHATATGPGVACAGNLLAHPAVPARMVERFEALVAADLGDRLLGAMRAALDAGGEAGPVHSAGMLIVDAVAWPVADLRVDWTDDNPVAALAALWSRWQPQMDAYVTRALDPSIAPSYGVPGDR
ncbi:MAG: DUF1028 domain-containing protein [Burkholderiales bacterium]|jgi:uncharacterized Ntn-hydrolase superfamily protein|nr:DUF1028 domain-containing protein [Burkholderiales bacterium]